MSDNSFNNQGQNPYSIPQNDPSYQPPNYNAPSEPSGLSIASIILAFFCSPIGIILGIMATVRAKKNNVSKAWPLVGLILSVVIFLISLTLIILLGTVFVGIFEQCADLGQGVHEVDGVTYTCG